MDKDQAQEPHQYIQNKEKNESSNSIGHEDYHLISLGTTIIIIHSIEGQIILDFHWFLKYEEAMD
jgi:hypothetical protein